MDNLTYAYKPNSNQLLKVSDTGNKTYGFKDGTNTDDDYAYDVNGNMTLDRNKGVSRIVYNHLNLPIYTGIETGGQRVNVRYIYDATGAKLQKMVSTDGNTSITAYASNYIYKDGELQFMNTTEGYVEPEEDGTFTYIYQYKDHLGNIRLSYADKDGDGHIDVLRNDADVDGDGDLATEIREEKHYYPYGLQQRGYNSNITGRPHPYGFNGMEYTQDLGLNHYEMDLRKYDPAIARWTGIDPVTHHSMSTYNAFDNNPIFWADPSGSDSSPGGLSTGRAKPAENLLIRNFSMSGAEVAAMENGGSTESTGDSSSKSALGLNASGSSSSSTASDGTCDDCPELSGEELSMYWFQHPDENVAFTTDGKGNFRYYYKDGGTEISTTTPAQKVLQDLTGLFLINVIGNVFKSLGLGSKVASKTARGSKPVLNSVNTGQRTGSAAYKSLNVKDGQHFFSNIVDNYASQATKFDLRGGDGVLRDLYQIGGSLRGRSGIFVNEHSSELAPDEDLLVELNVNEDDKSTIIDLLKAKGESEKEQAIKYWHQSELMAIEQSDKSIEEKLKDIELQWSRFDYPEDWRDFIYYLPNEKSSSNEGVYQIFLEYLNNVPDR